MCMLKNPRKTRIKYFYKVYWKADNNLYTIYTSHKHIIGKRYKAVNVKLGRKISNYLMEIISSPGYRHMYDANQIGFMGYKNKFIALGFTFPSEFVVVKCLIEDARIDYKDKEMDCQYITPLKIVRRGKEC